MKLYILEVIETILHDVNIKARSAKQAREKAEDEVRHGRCCIRDDTQCGEERLRVKVVNAV